MRFQDTVAEWEYPIYVSDRVRDRKSVFVAHASILRTSLQLQTFLDCLAEQPSLKRATHCMYAYQIAPSSSESSQKLRGQHDGGERGSGERLSRLLEMLECDNVVVVVSRWYGGVKLGSDRWKLISGVAKEALARGRFGKDKISESHVTVVPTKRNTKRKK